MAELSRFDRAVEPRQGSHQRRYWPHQEVLCNASAQRAGKLFHALDLICSCAAQAQTEVGRYAAIELCRSEFLPCLHVQHVLDSLRRSACLLDCHTPHVSKARLPGMLQLRQVNSRRATKQMAEWQGDGVMAECTCQTAMPDLPVCLRVVHLWNLTRPGQSCWSQR